MLSEAINICISSSIIISIKCKLKKITKRLIMSYILERVPTLVLKVTCQTTQLLAVPILPCCFTCSSICSHKAGLSLDPLDTYFDVSAPVV